MRLALRFVPLAVVSLLATGCPANVDAAGNEDPPDDLALQLATSGPGVGRGGTSQVQVTVTRTGGFTGEVTLAWGDYTGGELTADAVVVPAGQTTATFTCHAGATATLGAHEIHVIGTGNGTAAKSISFNVTVVQPGAFGVALSKNEFYAVPGITVVTTVQITRASYTQPLTVTATPVAGTGITATVVSQPGTGSTADVSIVLAANAPLTNLLGTPVDIKVSGAGAEDQHATVNVTVTADTYTLTASPPQVTYTAGSSPDCSIYCARVSQHWAIRGTAPAVAITGTAPPGIDITMTPLVLPDQDNVQYVHLAVGASVPAGTYQITLHGNIDGQFEKTATFAVQVVNFGTYSLSMQTAPLTVTIGTPAQDVLVINRAGGYTGSITVTGSGDDGAITVAANPSATAGNQTTLTVNVPNSSSVGTHTITVQGTTSQIANVTTTFAVIAQLPAGGTPTGIVIVPTDVHAAVGAMTQFTAYLVDAQGNRTLPAAGWNIGFAVTNSNYGTLQTLPAYDTTQRWRIGTVQAGPLTGNSTTVTAYYFNTTTGTSTFSANATLSVP